ncbi:hypothetical protein IFR05_005451 [Cadophora sp. M221]|nr:hypothetical protein IFR05_005451 [Cadophora sp. M221]
MLHTEADFTRMREKVSSNASPWILSWNLLTANSHSSASYKPRPAAIIYRGSDGVNTQNYALLFNDVAASYALALRWKISGNTTYANTAVNILNAWSSVLTSIQGSSDAALAAGIYGYQFANAAEIMRSYPEWEAESQKIFGTMLQEVFYPINHDFLVRHNNAATDHYWANWDLCNMASILAIGIFNDNETMYDEAITNFKSGVGNGNIDRFVWKEYTVDGQILGQGQESGRDQGHATLGFALVGALAQMAYNQDDDLFAYKNSKILAGSEYTAKYNVGFDVPYTTYQNSDVTQTEISNHSRGSLRPQWELLHAHYATLMGMNATFIEIMRDFVNCESGGAEGGGGDYGSSSGGFDQLGYGTLTFRRE